MNKLCALAVVLCLSAAPVVTFAGGDGYKDCSKKSMLKYKKKMKCGGDPGYEKPVAVVPEIDGAGAGLALSLIGGLVLVARERRRKSQA